MEAPFDHVAAPVEGLVEAAPALAAAGSACELVDASGVVAASPPQVGAEKVGRIALVGHDPLRPQTRPPRSTSGDADPVDHDLGLGAVIAGARGNEERQRPPVSGCDRDTRQRGNGMILKP
jgi:hypothetical protein